MKKDLIMHTARSMLELNEQLESHLSLSDLKLVTECTITSQWSLYLYNCLEYTSK